MVRKKLSLTEYLLMACNDSDVIVTLKRVLKTQLL
jgi:hypothetical protein